MTTLTKIQTAPDLVDQVYRTLLDAISEGKMAPGSRITQEDIAAQLAVSRLPVLQALRLLKKRWFCARRTWPRRTRRTLGRGLDDAHLPSTQRARLTRRTAGG